jgi:hypothetical protein
MAIGTALRRLWLFWMESEEDEMVAQHICWCVLALAAESSDLNPELREIVFDRAGSNKTSHAI